MWILIIIAVVICCIVAGIAQSQEDAQNEQKAQIKNQAASFVNYSKKSFPILQIKSPM